MSWITPGLTTTLLCRAGLAGVTFLLRRQGDDQFLEVAEAPEAVQATFRVHQAGNYSCSYRTHEAGAPSEPSATVTIEDMREPGGHPEGFLGEAAPGGQENCLYLDAPAQAGIWATVAHAVRWGGLGCHNGGQRSGGWRLGLLREQGVGDASAPAALLSCSHSAAAQAERGSGVRGVRRRPVPVGAPGLPELRGARGGRGVPAAARGPGAPGQQVEHHPGHRQL